jgi:hypothetical protein
MMTASRSRKALRLLLLFIEPGDGTDLGAPEQGTVAAHYLHRRGMADKELAGKINAQATMLQTPLLHTTFKHRALATTRFS